MYLHTKYSKMCILSNLSHMYHIYTEKCAWIYTHSILAENVLRRSKQIVCYALEEIMQQKSFFSYFPKNDKKGKNHLRL